MIARFRAQNSICRNSPMVYHSVITFCRGADAAVALNARCRMARMLVSALLPTFQRRKTLLASVAFLLVFGSTMLVSQPVTAQTENSGHRITITYGGEIIVRFPNYNFYSVLIHFFQVLVHFHNHLHYQQPISIFVQTDHCLD